MPRERRRTRASTGSSARYGSYEALLEDPDVEAVYISLPNGMHVEWTLRALEAGKHVLCEKPFSRHADEVEQAFDLADSAGLVLSEGFMWRHHPQTGEARRSWSPTARSAGCDSSAPPSASSSPSSSRCRRHALRPRARRRRADGRRLLLRQRDPAARGRARERLRGSRSSGRAASTSASPARSLSPTTSSRHFDCGFVLPSPGELEVVGEEASLFVGRRSTPASRASSSAARTETRADPGRAAPTRTGSSSRTSATRSAARRRSCSDGRTRVGQARTIEAFYRSASTTDASAA